MSAELARKLDAANEELKGKNPELGMKKLKQALDNPAAAGYAHAMLGTAFLRKGELPTAIEHLREAVRILPGFVPAHSNLGYALAASGAWEESQAELRRALILNPDDPHPSFVLGVMLLNEPTRLGEAEQLLTVARKAVRRAYLALAVLAGMRQDTSRGQEQLQLYSPDPAVRTTLSAWVNRVALLDQPASAFGLFSSAD